MNKTVMRATVLAIAVSATLACILLGVLYTAFIKDNPPSKTLTVPPYTLGVWEGNLAVFEGADTTPMQVYEVDITTLPVEEQQKLMAGIAVDKTQLQLLLEDYTS